MEKKEYIIVDAVQKERIKKILFEMKLYDEQIDKLNAFDIVNYWLPLHGETCVEMFKQKFHVYRKKISGCLGCEYCHNQNYGVCVQKDDMQELYEALNMAEVLILASPIYFQNISGPLQSVISRIYALGKPSKLKKCGMLLSSRIDGIYAGITEIHRTTARIMGVEDIGVITSVGDQNAVPERRKEMIESGFASEKLNESGIKEKLDEIREFGRKL